MHSRGSVERYVLEALGHVGEGASNAVPLLIRMMEDERVPPTLRYDAATTLGEIGGPARPAGPAIGRLLVQRHQADQPPNHLGLEMALARTGGTPVEAVHELELICERGGSLRRAFAAVALWDHDPSNSSYRDTVSSFLHEPLRELPKQHAAYSAVPLLVALGCHGTNAAVFEPEIRAVAECGKPALANCAAQVLQRINSCR
jgi:hypothetical protein